MYKNSTDFTFSIVVLALLTGSIGIVNSQPKALIRPRDYWAPIPLTTILDTDILEHYSNQKMNDLLDAHPSTARMPFLLAEVVDLTTKKVSYCNARSLLKDLCQKLMLQALAENSIKKLKLLCRLGAFSLVDSEGNTILHHAVRISNADMIAHILSLKPALIAQRNTAGDTPISLVPGSMPALYELRAKILNKDKAQPLPENSLLHKALAELLNCRQSNHLEEYSEMIRCIVAKKPELKELRDANGKTAYDILTSATMPSALSPGARNELLDLVAPAHTMDQGHTVKKIKTSHIRKASYDYTEQSPYKNFVELFKNFNMFVTLFTIASSEAPQFDYVGTFTDGFCFGVSPQQDLSAILLQTTYDRSPATCIAIGSLYEYGVGTSPHMPLAQRYYEIPAKHYNSAIAFYKLNLFYRLSLAGKTNLKLAYRYYSKSTETPEQRDELFEFAKHLIAPSDRKLSLGETAYTHGRELLQTLVIHGHEKATATLAQTPFNQA